MKMEGSQNNSFIYSGSDNLDVMACAKNYNNAIIKNFQKNCPGVKSVLDFGAGAGTFSKLLANEGYDVHCLEPDGDLSDRLRSQNLKTYDSLESVPDESYDAVISLNVFEHIENDIEILKQLKSKLKHDGRIYIYVPAFMLLYTSMDKKVGHYRRYSKSSLLKLVSECGLKTEIIRFADSLGFFITLLYKLIGNKNGNIDQSSIKFYDKMIFPLSRLLDNLTGSIFGKNLVIIASKA